MSKIYSDTKIFHFESKLKDLMEKKVSSPIHIRMKPTNKCNHKCYYCCYRNRDLFLGELMNEEDEIPLEKMKEIVTDFREMNVRAVTFSGGGEPLSYKYIKETIASMINSGIKVSILTNGSLLNGERAEILAKGASWVRISMDAVDAHSYAEKRGVGLKQFGKVCDNIAEFAGLKHNGCELGINFIVDNKNYRDIFGFMKLMKSLGVDHVKVCDCVLSVKRKKNFEIISPILKDVKKQIDISIRELADDDFSIIDKFDDFIEKNNNYKKGYYMCPFIQCLTIVAADLNVYTCQDKAYTSYGIIGSLKDISFRELWFNDKTKERLFNINPYKECNHHCTQHGKNLMLLDYMNINREHMEFI